MSEATQATEPLIDLIAERVLAKLQQPMLYTYAEAAQQLGYKSVGAIKHLVALGELQSINIGQGEQRETPRIERNELARFIRRRKLEGRG